MQVLYALKTIRSEVVLPRPAWTALPVSGFGMARKSGSSRAFPIIPKASCTRSIRSLAARFHPRETGGSEGLPDVALIHPPIENCGAEGLISLPLPFPPLEQVPAWPRVMAW